MTMKYLCKCGKLVEINAYLDVTVDGNGSQSIPTQCRICGGVQIIEFSFGTHYPAGSL